MTTPPPALDPECEPTLDPECEPTLDPECEPALDPECELCEAARMTEWFHEDDVCWVADCEVCSVPMVVWKRHGTEPPPDELEHMLAQLAAVADRRLGAGVWSFDQVMRQIPDHFHAHARDPDWWYRRMRR